MLQYLQLMTTAVTVHDLAAFSLLGLVVKSDVHAGEYLWGESFVVKGFPWNSPTDLKARQATWRENLRLNRVCSPRGAQERRDMDLRCLVSSKAKVGEKRNCYRAVPAKTWTVKELEGKIRREEEINVCEILSLYFPFK